MIELLPFLYFFAEFKIAVLNFSSQSCSNGEEFDRHEVIRRVCRQNELKLAPKMHFTLKKPFCYDAGFVPLLVSYSNFCDLFQISYSYIIDQRFEETLDNIHSCKLFWV